MAWPSESFPKTGRDSTDTAYSPTITHGVELFNKYWTNPSVVDAKRKDLSDIEEIRRVAAALDDFETVEKVILSIYDSVTIFDLLPI